jgi:hypothetical protein
MEVFPMQVETLAKHHDLGALISTHGWYRPVYRNAFLMLLFFFPFALLMAALIIGIPILILMIVFLIIVIRRLTTSQQIFFVYEQGIIDRRKSLAQVVKYSEIAELWSLNRLDAAPFVRVHREEYKVKTFDGKVYRFIQTINGIREVGDYLQYQVLQHQFSRVIAQLDQDAMLQFGKLKLSRDGLHQGKKILPWAELAAVGFESVSSGGNRFVSLVIRQQGAKYAWASYPRERFPNIALFMALVEQMRSPIPEPQA